MNTALHETLKKLISFQTFEGNTEKGQEVEALYKYVLASIPDTYQYDFINHEGYESLVIYTKSKKSPKIVLQSHIDVVPASKDLFSAKISKDGKHMHGRGVSDMKFAAACYVHLLNELANEDLDIAVWLTSDEEQGGHDGIGYMLQEEGYSSDICILPDSGTENMWGLTTGAKGAYMFTATAQGVGAHGSRPWQGVSALELIYNFFNDIKDHALFNTSDPDNWHNTINMGTLEGGTAFNVIPALATGKFDVRIIEDAQRGAVIELIRTTAEKYNVLVSEDWSAHAMHLDLEHPLVMGFRKTLDEHGVDYVLSKDHGGSDARFFAEKGIPVIMLKPLCGGNHESHEWIDLMSLDTYYRVLIDYVRTHA